MNSVRAVCDRSGTIRFLKDGDPTDGQLPIAAGEEAALRRAIEPLARHGYDGKTLIVAGVRDAEDDIEALVCLDAFCRRTRERLEAPGEATG